MNPSLDFAQKLSQAYSSACKPLCVSLGLPQTAFDILLFLANNPRYTTARDITEVRKIKANLVSVNVSRLVEDGYLTRNAVTGDRRKVQLLLTEKAQPVVQQGQALQQRFFTDLFSVMDEDTRKGFFHALSIMDQNLDHLVKGA